MEQTKRKAVLAVPEGLQTVTPYLVVDDAAKLIEFIEDTFDGEVSSVTHRDDNRIMHATVTLGTSTIMIADTMEGMQPHTAMLYVYLEDSDKVFKKAIDAKATSIQEPKTEFYGDRAGAVKDQWGNIWWIATHVEDVDPKELDRRAQEALKERKKKAADVHA